MKLPVIKLGPKLDFPFRAPTKPTNVTVPGTVTQTGANFETEWARTPQAKATRAAIVDLILRPAVAGLARPTRLGKDRLVDLEGPVIFAPNHQSHLDTSLLLTSIPRHLRQDVVVAAAADYFFTTRLTGTVAALSIGAIPIERKKVGRQSADLASEVIEDGWSILIYPEGGRSKDGWGQPFRGGAAYLSIKTGAPIVPVYLSGTRRILRKGATLPKPSRTAVNFGKPLWPAEAESSRNLNRRLEASVASLRDEITSGWYEARIKAHAKETPSLGGPDASSWRRSWALGKATKRTKPSWP